MALFSTIIRRTLFSNPPNNRHSLSSFSSSPPSDQTVVTTSVSILKHHRSKSRWTYLRSLFPTGFTPTEVSQITLQLRNNPHLALRFFLFTLHHSLCNHSLLSYSTIIHTLSRSRLKPQALTLIQSALRKFPDPNSPNSTNPPEIFEILVKTYRICDSAPFVFDLLVKACLQAKRIDQSIEIVRMLRSRNIFPLISTCNSLIRVVSKCRGCFVGYDLCKEVFGFDCGREKGHGGGVKGVVPNAHTFNIIMVAFYRDGLVENVEDVWDEMGRMDCEPNGYSYSVLMAAYCEDGRMGEALRVWEEMGIKGVKHDVVAYNTIIGGFCKIGDVGTAKEFFRMMVLSGVESTCLTSEPLINVYCNVGDVNLAMLLYKDMCRKTF